MKICIPISEDRGMESPICGHFGSTPAFLLMDTETRAYRVLANGQAHHEHRHCAPLAMLAGEQVEAFIVGGIGAGALAKLLDLGATVYRGNRGSVAESLEAFAKGALPTVTPADTCSHHHG